MTGHYQTSPMTAGSLYPLVNRTYKASHRFQWVREAYVNAVQAGAKNIRFDTEWEAVRTLGLHRRIVVDDGPGIPRTDCAGYLNTFGGSGKTVGEAEENFGVGLKSSLLPWNPDGVVLISKTADGETTLMWLHRSTTSDGGFTYGARRLPTLDGPTDTVPLEGVDSYKVDGVDWANVFPADIASGLAIVLCGSPDSPHTVMGDPNREEDTKYGIIQYLNTRFLTLPVQASVNQYANYSDLSTWPATSESAEKHRRPQGIAHQIDLAAPSPAANGRALVAKGTVPIAATAEYPAARLHWWLSDSPASPSPSGLGIHLPLIGAQFEAHRGLTETFDLSGTAFGTDAKPRTHQFVSAVPVRDRVALLLEIIPSDKHGVFQDQSRAHLLVDGPSGARSIPWSHYRDQWHANMPGPIKQAINEYIQALADDDGDAVSDKDLKRLGERWGQALRKVRMLAPSTTGNALTGVPASGLGASSRRERLQSRTSPSGQRPPGLRGEGSAPGREREISLGLVGVSVINEPEEPYLVTYDAGTKTAYLNAGNPRYTRIVDAILQPYVEDGRVTDDIVRALVTKDIERAIRNHLTLAVTDAAAQARAIPAEREHLLSDHTLAATLLGIGHIDYMAARMISATLNGRRTTKKK